MKKQGARRLESRGKNQEERRSILVGANSITRNIRAVHIYNQFKTNNTITDYSLYLKMGTSKIISEINKLPVSERLALIELTIKKIREDERKKSLAVAVDLLYDDYLNDPELTAFTQIDHDDFYEAK